MNTSRSTRGGFFEPAILVMVVSLMLAGCLGGGESSNNESATDTTAPSAPSALVAAAASTDSIALNWTASKDDVSVIGYKIYREGTEISTSASNSFRDSALLASTLYSYAVAAYDAAGNVSTQSTSASATTLAAGVTDTTPPTAPANLIATAVSDGQVNLSWTGSTDSAGVAAYEVWRGSSKIATVTTLSYNDAGLAASTSYSYIVKAFDGAGNVSGASNMAIATTLAAGAVAAADTTAPTVPSGLITTPTSTSRINLVWTASTDAVGVTGYKIYRGGTYLTSVPGTAMPDTGLAASTNYCYEITAYDAANNESAKSSPAVCANTLTVPATTAPTVITPNPANNSTGANGNTVVSVTFSEAMDPATITSAAFKLAYFDDLTSVFLPLTGTVTCNSATATFTLPGGLNYGTRYEATITTGAKDLAGNALAAEYVWRFQTTHRMGGSLQGNTLSLSNVYSVLTGSGSVGSTDAVGILASFANPGGITTDGTNLYVADTGNDKIRKIVIATGQVTTLAGDGTAGNMDSDFAAANGYAVNFDHPTGITTDGVNLYVADRNNHTIRKIEIATGLVSTLAGYGYSSGSADAVGGYARFNAPAGITYDGYYLYVADTGNQKIRRIDPVSQDVTTIAGTGVSGAHNDTGTLASFNTPFGITTDGTNLYVADTMNNLIRQIVISSKAVTTLAGSGSSGSVDATGALASFGTPAGITSDGTNLYVTDNANYMIRKIATSTGAVTTLKKQYGPFLSTVAVNGPYGITTDGASIYVVEQNGQKISKIQ